MPPSRAVPVSEQKTHSGTLDQPAGEEEGGGGLGNHLARDLYRQVLELRDLLEAVARELERLASDEPNGAP